MARKKSDSKDPKDNSAVEADLSNVSKRTTRVSPAPVATEQDGAGSYIGP